MNYHILHELSDPALIRLSERQRAVLLRIFNAASSTLAYEAATGADFIIEARTYLARMGFITVDEEAKTIRVTSSGLEVLVSNGLIDLNDELTETGRDLLYDLETEIHAVNVSEDIHLFPYINSLIESKNDYNVICGFPGIGKSTLINQLKGTGTKILDSDSSKFPKSDFPENYITHIKEKIGEGYKILASSHDVVRNALLKEKIPFILVYPKAYLESEYLDRYEKRGSPETFIKLLKDNFDKWIKECESIKSPLVKHVRLSRNEYLANNKEIKSLLDLSLNEMTARTDPISTNDEKMLHQTLVKVNNEGDIAGYLAGRTYKVLNVGETSSFIVLKDNEPISLISGQYVTVLGEKMFQIHVLYSVKEHRQEGGITSLLLFLRNSLDLKLIFYGLQSPLAIAALNSAMGKAHFRNNAYWLNAKTGEKVKYEADDKRDDYVINDWKIVIEHVDDNNNFSKFKWMDFLPIPCIGYGTAE